MATLASPELRSSDLFNKHEKALQEAIEAIHRREFYARFPEPPSGKIYGENANEEGRRAFEEQLNQHFEMLQTGEGWITGREISPYTGEDLNVDYPGVSETGTYVERSKAALKQWRHIHVKDRAGLLIESLDRISKRFFELAYATMHTTGQAFIMSFQASGPHAMDRALEAIGMAYYELTRFPESVDWTKPMGKFDVSLKKFYKTVPRGVALAVGCSTFPVWNTVPGIYASLMTGNTVIVKPHPNVVYPIALVVDEIQKVLHEYGLDPHTIQLAPDPGAKPITKELAEHKDVKIIDYTGGTAFGDYIEDLPGKITFTEKAGVNSVILDSCNDLKSVMQNLAFSISLYSGQMCTAPQNFFIPKDGMMVNGERMSYEAVVKELTDAITGLVTHEKMGPGTLGAIQNVNTCTRVEDAENLGLKVLRSSTDVTNPEFPDARIKTPVVLEVSEDKRNIIGEEMFGPIVFVIPTKSTEESVQLAKELALEKGAITCSAYCTDEKLISYIADEMSESYTSVAFNLTGPIWVNQSAGFSDFHVTGGNPSGNASLTDPEYVTKRFEIVGIRMG